MKPADGALLATVPVIARRLGIGLNTAYDLVHAGLLPYVKVGRKILVPVRAADALVERVMAGEIRELP